MAEDIVVEHKGSESLLIFKDVNRISQQIIDSLLIESFEKGQQKRWDPFVIPYTKEDLLRFDSKRRMF